MSEDYSKATLNIRNQLVSKAKLAIDKCSSMKSFRVNFKRLVVKYQNPETKQEFHRGFNLADIETNPYWYIPNKRQTVRTT